MTTRHTQGRLALSREYQQFVVTEDGRYTSFARTLQAEPTDEAQANARRLVACWNACEGISTESLERGPSPAEGFQREQNRADLAERERDELLKAMKHIATYGRKMDFDAVAVARATIAKVEGGAA